MSTYNFTIVNNSLRVEVDTTGGDFNERANTFKSPSFALVNNKIKFYESGIYVMALSFNEFGTIDGNTPADLVDALDLLDAATANFNGGGSAPNTENLFCVVRLNTGETNWEFVEDSNHEKSSNIQSIETNPAAGYNFAIFHNSNFTKIGSLIAGIDETYSSFGLKIGASVGLTQSLFRVTKDGFTIRALVSGGVLSFANDVGQIVKNTDFSYTFDTGTGRMVISHTNLVCTYGDMVILTPYGTAYTTRLISKTATSATFEWYNNGTLVTALSTSMKLYLTRTGTFQCTNEQIANSGANFWISGIFKK